MKNKLTNILLIVGYAALITFVFAFPHPPEPIAHPSQSRDEWTNDRVIEETKKCEDAGLVANRIYNGWTYKTTDIQCVPKAQS